MFFFRLPLVTESKNQSYQEKSKTVEIKESRDQLIFLKHNHSPTQILQAHLVTVPGTATGPQPSTVSHIGIISDR